MILEKSQVFGLAKLGKTPAPDAKRR
jgi:hypothetical protein